MSADDDVDDEGRRGRARRATPHSDKNEEKQVKEGRKEEGAALSPIEDEEGRKEGSQSIRDSCQLPDGDNATAAKRKERRKKERKSGKEGTGKRRRQEWEEGSREQTEQRKG